MPNELKGAVVAKFSTITAFAKAIKWDRKKASRIVNHLQEPTTADMYQMVKLLDVKNCDDFVRIFLPEITTMWEA